MNPGDDLLFWSSHLGSLKTHHTQLSVIRLAREDVLAAPSCVRPAEANVKQVSFNDWVHNRRITFKRKKAKGRRAMKRKTSLHSVLVILVFSLRLLSSSSLSVFSRILSSSLLVFSSRCAPFTVFTSLFRWQASAVEAYTRRKTEENR